MYLHDEQLQTSASSVLVRATARVCLLASFFFDHHCFQYKRLHINRSTSRVQASMQAPARGQYMWLAHGLATMSCNSDANKGNKGEFVLLCDRSHGRSTSTGRADDARDARLHAGACMQLAAHAAGSQCTHCSLRRSLKEVWIRTRRSDKTARRLLLLKQDTWQMHYREWQAIA